VVDALSLIPIWPGLKNPPAGAASTANFAAGATPAN